MTPTRSTSTRGQAQTVVAVLLGAVVAVGLAAFAFSRPGGVAGSPAAPSAHPSASPSAAPIVVPTASPNNGSTVVVLESASGHDVSLNIHDDSGSIVKAASGKPGEGMSIRWHDADVQNVDARTIAIRWAAFPLDEVLDLGVNVASGQYELTFVQAGPYPNTDAMGEDRILILTFDAPVSANDVSVEILNRTVD